MEWEGTEKIVGAVCDNGGELSKNVNLSVVIA